MKFFLNLKLATKLLTGFIMISIITAVVGVVGVTNLRKIDASYSSMYDHMTVPISQLSDMSRALEQVRIYVRDGVISNEAEEINETINKIKQNEQEIDKLSGEYDKLIISTEMRAAFDEFKKADDAYFKEVAKLTEFMKQNKDAEATVMMAANSEAGLAARAEEAAIEKLKSMKVADAGKTSEANTAATNSVIRTMIIIIIISIIFALIIGIYLSSVISRPVKRLSLAADKLAVGDINVDIKSTTKDEIGILTKSFEMMVENIKGQALAAERIAEGDLTVELVPKSDEDILTKSMKYVVETLKGLVAESSMLTTAAVAGKLDTRGNAQKFKGGYKDIVDGVNKTLDAVIGPLNVSAEYVERISKGDIPVRITDTYHGDFNEIKNNLNMCIDAVNALIADANILSKAAVEGKLDTRADVTKHNGDFRKIVQGVNDTLDAVIGPLNVSAEYVERISKGDIPARITDTYHGDFNEIKNNLNMCIDAINALVADANMLSAAAVEGRLSTRADVTRHSGDFRKIVQGVNDTLDAVITPLDFASKYVSRMAAGDELETIENNYKGDFRILIDNLNAVKDSLYILLGESGKLTQAALNGQLSVRGDLNRLKGGYAQIVKGVNDTLDAVIKPVQEAAYVLEEMSKGNLKLRVNGDYKGDHALIKNALNNTINAVSDHITETSRVLTEMSKGNLDVNVTGTYNGDFVDMKESTNMIIEKFNEVLSEINIAAEQVSAGSRQVSDSSQALSQGSTEQASSVQEITAAMTEIAEQTKKNAVNANKANELASTARDNAVQGNSQMSEMIKAMTEINDSSSNISKIIKVIDDIAFQTNILALNAAVEAARAGQHGKGFAVVAEEVRNLAARSANAAKETTVMIEGSIKKVEIGTKIANDTAFALNNIVKDVSSAAELVGEIAGASNEQATGITQINQAIEEVSKVTQMNTATAEESAAASEELSSQALVLKERVNRFSLKKGGSSGGRMGSINPDMLRSIEEFMKNRNNDGNWNSAHDEAAVSSSKIKISLDDREFGKY